MIQVKRLNSQTAYINSDLIEIIEETPDTVITLTTGKKFVVEESAQQIVKKIIEFKRKIYSNLPEIVENGK